MDANLERLKAERVLEEIETGKISIADMDHEAIYDMVLEATDSKQAANSYRVAAIKAKQRPKSPA